MVKEQIFVNDNPTGWNRIEDEFGNESEDTSVLNGALRSGRNP